MTKAVGSAMRNNSCERAVFNRRDAIAVFAIILAAAAGFILPKLAGGSAGKVYAVITCGNETVYEIPLDADGEYTCPELKDMVFTVSNGKISVTKSSCGDHTCIRTGEISNHGEVIVCVPNKAAVTIENEKKNSNLDVILR